MIDVEMVYWRCRTIADTDSHRDGLEAVAQAARAEALEEAIEAIQSKVSAINLGNDISEILVDAIRALANGAGDERG